MKPLRFFLVGCGRISPRHIRAIRENREQAELASLPKTAPLERDYAVRVNKTHKIKTDTGIEITVPSDFFNNPDYIEFISNDDGTISINIKHVGQIINR